MDKKWTLFGIICVIAVIYSSILYYSSCISLRDITAEREEAERVGRTLEAEKEALRRDIEGLKDDDTLRALAWERLGMAESGEIIFYFADREEK